jgi:hypothetical protein
VSKDVCGHFSARRKSNVSSRPSHRSEIPSAKVINRSRASGRSSRVSRPERNDPRLTVPTERLPCLMGAARTHTYIGMFKASSKADLLMLSLTTNLPDAHDSAIANERWASMFAVGDGVMNVAFPVRSRPGDGNKEGPCRPVAIDAKVRLSQWLRECQRNEQGIEELGGQ